MGGILDKLDQWLRGLLTEGIKGNLTGMFDSVNTKVGEIAGEVGKTPQGWNGGVFSMIQNLSETVIVPIAGVILTFVMCVELIQMVTERNNLHDIDTWMFFKWVFKTFCAVLIVTNTWNIVMGIFDAAQSVVNSSAGVIIGNTSVDISGVLGNLDAQMEALETGELFGDKAHIVYVNGSYRGNDEVGWLMHDFNCKDYREMHNPKIAERVRYFKEEPKGVTEMCETMQKIVDRERDDADVKARMDIALNLWSEGEHDLDKISRTTKLSIEQVRRAITVVQPA